MENAFDFGFEEGGKFPLKTMLKELENLGD